jgi:tRNA pseudouridine55 synthase
MTHGYLNINKAQGMTSHDVVAKLRRGLRISKVGHAGTLDPLATGVLVICLGHATRLSDYVMHGVKSYSAQVLLGANTDTYDSAGQITTRYPIEHLTRAQVEQAVMAFVGEIDQVPPMYSAIKQGGQRLYDLARQGVTVERQARRIHIHSIALTHYDLPHITLEVTCSAGTYIRSLAFDLGARLGVGAHLTALARTASGAFALHNAHTVDAILADAQWVDHLLPMDTPVNHWLAVQCTVADVADLRKGKRIQTTTTPDSTPARAIAPDGTLMALLESRDGVWQPTKVFLDHTT